LAIDPLTPTTLYVGNDGVYKSTDGAGSWSVGLPEVNITALAIDPVSPTTLYAGSDSGVFVQVGSCSGDCDGNGDVTVDELIVMVNIALGDRQAAACPNGFAPPVEISAIIQAVNNAMNGCGG